MIEAMALVLLSKGECMNVGQLYHLSIQSYLDKKSVLIQHEIGGIIHKKALREMEQIM